MRTDVLSRSLKMAASSLNSSQLSPSFSLSSERKRKRHHQVLEGHEPKSLDVHQFTSKNRGERSCVWDKRHVHEDRKNRVTHWEAKKGRWTEKDRGKKARKRKGTGLKESSSFPLDFVRRGLLPQLHETPVAEDGHSAQRSDCNPFYWRLSRR